MGVERSASVLGPVPIGPFGVAEHFKCRSLRPRISLELFLAECLTASRARRNRRRLSGGCGAGAKKESITRPVGGTFAAAAADMWAPSARPADKFQRRSEYPASQFSLARFPDNSARQVCEIPRWGLVRWAAECLDREEIETKGTSRRAVSVSSQCALATRLSPSVSVFSARSAASFMKLQGADGADRGGNFAPSITLLPLRVWRAK